MHELRFNENIDKSINSHTLLVYSKKKQCNCICLLECTFAFTCRVVPCHATNCHNLSSKYYIQQNKTNIGKTSDIFFHKRVDLCLNVCPKIDLCITANAICICSIFALSTFYCNKLNAQNVPMILDGKLYFRFIRYGFIFHSCLCRFI